MQEAPLSGQREEISASVENRSKAKDADNNSLRS